MAAADGRDKRRTMVLVLLLIALPLGACQTQMPGNPSGHIVTSIDSKSAVGYISRIRATHSLSSLAVDPQLEKAAAEQAALMARAGRMSHRTAWGRDFSARMRRSGVESSAAENLAHGNIELDGILDMWMHSPGHRRNLLGSHYRRFGLASASNGKRGERYWALILAD